MYRNVLGKASLLRRRRRRGQCSRRTRLNAIRALMQKMLEAYNLKYSGPVMSAIVNGEKDGIQNVPNNPESSTVEIQPEMYHDFDKVSERPGTPSSFVSCANAEIFDTSGPSTMEIQPEMCHDSDKVSERLETSSSFVSCTNAEIFDTSGPSTMEIRSEMYADNVSERSEMPNSFVECVSTEIISNRELSTVEIQTEIRDSAEQPEQPETLNIMECINAKVVGNPGPSSMAIQSEIYDSAAKVPKLETSNFIESTSAEIIDPESFTMEILSKMSSADKIFEQLEMLTSMESTSTKIIDNRRPSIMDIQPEMYGSTEKVVKQPEILNSMEHSSTEVIDISSNSDTNIVSSTDSESDSFSDESYDDISIINTVKAVSDPGPSHCSHLAGNSLSSNQVETAASSSDRQAVAINNKLRNGSEERVEENNNNVSYTEDVSKKKSKDPKPGCSKHSDKPPSMSPESGGVYSFNNLDELLKDAKLIHALLPKLSQRLIYRTLSNNKFARNRIELTLWDLLPVERPLPQYLQKRKCSDEICFIKHNNSNKHKNNSLQKNQVDTNMALKKKEQACARNEVTVDNRKSENKEFISHVLTDKIDGMEKNMLPKMAALNSTNNDINQQSAIPIKKAKVKLDEPIKYVEEGSDANCSKIFVAPEVNSQIKESHSIQSAEAGKKSEFDRLSKLFLQPPKLTLHNNFTTQNNERVYKPTVPFLAPPKLKVIDRSAIPTTSPTATIPTYIPAVPDGFNVMQMKQNKQIIGPSNPSSSKYIIPNYPITIKIPPKITNVKKQNKTIVPVFNPNPSSFTRSHTLLDASPNDKKASDIRVVPRQNSMWQQINLQRAETILIEPEAANALQQRITTQVIPAVALNNPSSVAAPMSSSIVIAQSTSDHQKASGSNMGAPQVYEDKVVQQRPAILTKPETINWKLEQLETRNAMTDTKLKTYAYACKEKPKEIPNNHTEIILSQKANKIYLRLIPMFPTVKPPHIRKLCYDWIKDEDGNEITLINTLVEILLNNQTNLSVEEVKPLEPEATTSKRDYNMNEQYADLLMIFPEADPIYLRKVAEETYSNPERIKEFVQSKLENPDYPTRAQYLTKKKITQQQKQYTTNFKIKQFLEIFPDPFSYFEDEKRKCEFNPHAVDFLKYYFSQLRVNTLVRVYSQYMNNLSLTARALEVLNSDMKSKRHCNWTATEDIPFLQECAFIQHKTELRKYLDEIKAKEKQEFNELKAKNELLECQCCYDNECVPSKCSTCEDGHIFCNSCIVRSTDVVLGDGKTRVDCLLQCGCEFPLSVLQHVLPPTKFSILLCKRQEAEVIAAGVEGLVSCPFCHFASIPPPEDKIFKCLNPECMKESCRLCKELNHVPLKCDEKKTESARLFLEEKMTQALVRKCYRCSRMFFKEEGCNKMTCVCGAQMCYICDKPVTNYHHFQGQGAENSNLCPLWSDDRRMNAEGVIKVCEETLKQIKKKDPKIDINVNGLLPTLPPKTNGPHENIPNAVIGLQNRFARYLQ